MATVTTQRTRAPPRCSICRQPGHTKRKCPQAVERPTVAAVTTPIEATDCPICMEPLGKTNCCTTNCGHQFCLQCFVTHTKTKSNCPVCRADIPGASPQRPATYMSTQYSTAAAALARAEGYRDAARVLAREPYGFSIFIQNHSNNPADIYWQSPTGMPLATHRNIAAGTVRRIHVGRQGDRFSLVASVPGLPAQQPTPLVNTHQCPTSLISKQTRLKCNICLQAINLFK